MVFFMCRNASGHSVDSLRCSNRTKDHRMTNMKQFIFDSVLSLHSITVRRLSNYSLQISNYSLLITHFAVVNFQNVLVDSVVPPAFFARTCQ